MRKDAVTAYDALDRVPVIGSLLVDLLDLWGAVPDARRMQQGTRRMLADDRPRNTLTTRAPQGDSATRAPRDHEAA